MKPKSRVADSEDKPEAFVPLPPGTTVTVTTPGETHLASCARCIYGVRSRQWGQAGIECRRHAPRPGVEQWPIRWPIVREDAGCAEGRNGPAKNAEPVA